MERALKERLVGAAVLMAAAIILIPEMLGGPDRNEPSAAPERVRAARGDASIKTYTIDLDRAPDTHSQAVVSPEENRAPPPEEEPVIASAPAQPSAETHEGTPPQPQEEPQSKPESLPVPSPSPEKTGPAPTPARDVVEPPTGATPAAPARTLASGSSNLTSSAWAVQLGSFSKQSTAERLVNELRGKGHDAFVMPVKSGSATLYRVRVGPIKDRSGAERTLRELRSIVPGAAVVAHP